MAINTFLLLERDRKTFFDVVSKQYQVYLVISVIGFMDIISDLAITIKQYLLHTHQYDIKQRNMGGKKTQINDEIKLNK